MAYKKAELEKQALAAIKKHKCVFIEEIVSFLPCDKKTFYTKKLHESNEIKDALHASKIETKRKLRKKMYEADTPTAWIALYKLIGTIEDTHRLNGSRQEIKSEVEAKVDIKIDKKISELWGDDE